MTIIVVDPTEAAFPHAQIKLAPPAATTSKNAETDEIGEIKLRVVSGDYRLFVAVPDFASWAESIRVDAAASQKVRVTLQLACGSQIVRVLSQNPAIDPSSFVTIAVTDASGAAVPYAQIGVCPIDTTLKSIETDQSGKIFLKLAPGRYELIVASSGFRRWAKPMEFKGNGHQSVSAVLEACGNTTEPCSVVESNHRLPTE